MIEHHIQREILGTLTQAGSLKYSDLKPAGMEGNIFMYHLNLLIRAGYVEKENASYTLAIKGLQYADTLSMKNLKPRMQPKALVILALQNDEGKWLLARRKTQPHLGQYMLPSGKRHFGELRDEHAIRELEEKTGWSLSLAHRGEAEIVLLRNEQPLTHIIGDIYTGTQHNTLLPKETNRFEYEWASSDQIKPPFLPGTDTILHALETSRDSLSLSLRLDA